MFRYIRISEFRYIEIYRSLMRYIEIAKFRCIEISNVFCGPSPDFPVLFVDTERSLCIYLVSIIEIVHIDDSFFISISYRNPFRYRYPTLTCTRYRITRMRQDTRPLGRIPRISTPIFSTTGRVQNQKTPSDMHLWKYLGRVLSKPPFLSVPLLLYEEKVDA